jgi:hypothetical protein
LRICSRKICRFGAVALQSQQPKTEGEKGKNQLDLTTKFTNLLKSQPEPLGKIE